MKPKADWARMAGWPIHELVELTLGPDFELGGAPIGAKDAWDVKWARDVG